jgi:aminoglycoside phosphotransferase (APT) family kinase protein
MIPDAIREKLSVAGYDPLAVERTSTRGIRSETFRIEHLAGSAILKIYNEQGGTSAAKWLRERTALRSLAGFAVPRLLLDAHTGWLLMEYFPGTTVHEMWDNASAQVRKELSKDLGKWYARILLAPQDPATHDAIRASRADANPDSIPAAIAAIDALRHREPLVCRPVYLAALKWIEAHRQSLSDSPQLLIKRDCNHDNAIVEGGRVRGLIDWEEACIGNRWVHLGIVLDHTYFLDWPAVRAGLESVTGPWGREEEEIVFAGAMLCVWRKILYMFPGPSAWFGDGTRIENRMRSIAVAIGKSGVLEDGPPKTGEQHVRF